MLPISFDPARTECIFCDSPKLLRYAADAFDGSSGDLVHIRECQNCAFAWQYPLGRTETESKVHFEASYADRGRTTSKYFDESVKEQIARAELAFLHQLIAAPAAVLDFGAGAGVFARIAAEERYRVTAVDPAISSNPNQGDATFKVLKGDISLISSSEKFDVITMWDVIEHLVDPADTLTRLRDLLKPGGWIIIETGNFKSADRIRGHTAHWIYQLDHRWYFSPESMRRLLLSQGFTRTVACDRVLRPNWQGHAHFAGPSLKGLVRRLLTRRSRLRSTLRQQLELRKAKQWELSGLGIFTIAAQFGPPGHPADRR